MSATAYTIDIEYPSAFGAYQAPVHMAYAASLGGQQTVPVYRPFRYCDLGCGAGLTLCVLADCYPHAEFHGVDINPKHIATARKLAKQANLKNVHFHEANFADLNALKLPSFDYAALSGVYSWLDSSTRHAVLESLTERLSKDGALFLHYSALPGNNQIDALYNLIREVAAEIEGDSVSRFKQSLGIIQRMSKIDAVFFRANPFARAWLDGIGQQDVRSMAHEVLNAQKTSLSVRDASDEVAKCGLAFVANAQIEFNHIALVSPANLTNELAKTSRIAREMILDAIRNAHSRMDVYAFPRANIAFEHLMGGYVLDRLSTGVLLSERRKLTSASGINFLAPVYEDLLISCKRPARTIEEILKDNLLAKYERMQVVEAMQHLIATKLLHLICRPYAPNLSVGDNLDLASPLNRILLEEQIEMTGQIPFASSVAGTQILLPPADRLALLSLVDGDFEAAWRRMSSTGQRITNGGLPVSGARQLQNIARERANDMEKILIPMLSGLGIITSNASV